MSAKDESTQVTAETITPHSAPFKKDLGADEGHFKRKYRFKTIVLICSLILLVICGGWFLHYLSKKPLQKEEIGSRTLPIKTKIKEKPVEQPKKLPATLDPAQQAEDKQNAEQKLSLYMEAKGKLDQKSAAEWGGEPYTTMIQIGQEADAHFMGKQYRAAADKYARAAGMAAELADRTNDILLRLLEEGSGALNAGDGSLAQSKFTVALMIEPSNPTAQRGLKRAKTIETVMQLVASGKQHEQNNALSSAQADYLKALEIDSDANEARKGLNRVKGLLKEKQFQRLISEGLAAFHHNDYQLARTRLLKAKSLKPESRQVLDALAQVDQAIRLASIDTLRQQAQSDERSENWQSALKSYLAVLKIDKNVQFATRGKERALEQIRTNKRIDFFLAKPEVLASDSQLNNAVLLLNESKELKPQGPKMTARIKKLEELVSIAQKPLKITIESDNLTDIAVYKVGKLGRFSVRELELRPGTYTVVGTRDGYQDVRQKIEVKPGRQLLRVTIKCRVKI